MFKKESSPDDVDRTFPNRHHPNIIQGLNSQNNSQHKSLNSRDCYFSAGIAQVLLQTLADNIFLRYRKFCCSVSLTKLTMSVGVVFSCERNRSCVSADTGVFSFTRLEKHQPTSAKKHYSPTLIKKMIVDVGQER